jgi:predicted metal-binding protein
LKPEYVDAATDAKKRLHEIVCRLASLCITEGYHFKAIPAMEAVGVDVMATAKKAGLHLSFGQNESRGWVVIALVD